MATVISIPYRCPNCGGSQKFKTLKELRIHLQTEHAVIFDQSQRLSTNSSGRKLPHHSPLLELFHADARKLEEDLRVSKEEELNNKRFRMEYEGVESPRTNVSNRRQFEGYPPKATFREYGLSSRQNKSLYKNKNTNADNGFETFYHSLHNNSNEDVINNSSPVESKMFSFPNQMFSEQKSKQPFYHTGLQINEVKKPSENQRHQRAINKKIDNKHVVETLNSLSHDVILERASQHATANSLYTAQDVLSGIEQAAEERIAQQQFLTDSLAHELKVKEKRLASVMDEMDKLHSQQLETVENMNLMKQKYDQENKKLQKDLEQKQTELASLNQQITETKQVIGKDNENIFQKPEKLSSNDTLKENEAVNSNLHSAFLPVSSSINVNNDSERVQNVAEGVAENLQQDQMAPQELSIKDKELIVIKKKAQQLERDKQNLLMEMQNLLETASVDNEKLKAELDSRSEKLSKLNCDLEQSKQEQAELLDETNALYHQADVSLSVLKTMLKEREYQLISMSSSLEQAKLNQEKLAKERDECFLLAKEKEDMYKSLLDANSSQVKSVKEMLDSTQKEKQKLERGVSDLREKLAAKDEQDRHLTNNVARLQSELAEKEITQSEMKEKIRRREEKLQKAKSEMERVTKFLRTTAEKELAARSKLEVFISGLIDRARKAEVELEKLKSHQLAESSKKYPRHRDVRSIGRSDNPHHHSQENLLHPHRTPQESSRLNTNTSNSRHADKMNRERHRSPTSVENHYSSPSKYKAGQQRYGNQQNPDAAIRYRQDLNHEASLHSSYHHGTSHLTFDNTPEVERMYHNVNRQAYIQPSDPLQSQKRHKTDGGRVKQLIPHNSVHENVALAIDDNGIMWEQNSPYYLRDRNLEFNNRYGPLFNERAVHQRLNDDTDIDEDFTDYVHENEQVSYDRAARTKNLQVPTASIINNARVTSHQKDHIPYNNPQSKLSFEKAQSNHSQGTQFDQLRPANDYSTTESSEGSPLYKARAVQKRVEQLTSLNSSFPRTGSKQSGGFEVSHLDRESDFSSSSYASIIHPHKHLKHNKTEQYDEEKVRSEFIIKESFHFSQTNPTLNENKQQPEVSHQSIIKDSYNHPQTSPSLSENKQHTEVSNKSAVHGTFNHPQTNSALEENKQHTEVSNKSAVQGTFNHPQTNSALEENKQHTEVSNKPAVKNLNNHPQTSSNSNENIEHTQVEVSNKSPANDPSHYPQTNSTSDENKQHAEVSYKSAVEEPYHSPQTSPAVNEIKNNSNENPPVDTATNRSGNASNEPHQHNKGILISASVDNSEHTPSELPVAVATIEQSNVLSSEKVVATLEDDSLKESNKASVNSPTDSVMAKDLPSKILENKKLLQEHADDNNLRPEEEIISQSEAQSTSEDELLDDDLSPAVKTKHKMSVDASTDTDLEKLAMPGQQLQKGFVAKKIIPHKKRTIRKKSRPKAQLKKSASQDSLSSDIDDLVDEEREKRLALRKMRVVLFRVFYYLDTKTLLAVACVSKEWCRVSRHPALWRHVSMANGSVSSDFLITLSKWCTQTKSLSLKGLRGKRTLGEDSPENHQQATRGSLEHGLETILSTCHNTITEIHITDCDNILTDKCLWLVSGYCRLLTALTYLSSKDPLTPQLMWAIGGGCPGITRLFVQPQQPCEKTGAMNNRCLLLIAQLYPDIEELGLGGKEFDRAGLLPLITSCQRLKNLHLDHSLAVTADLTSALCKAGLKHLHALTISSTFVEAKAIQNIKESCRQLKRIHVRVNLQDCVNDPTKSKDKETYKKMVKALEALKAKAGFGIIFTLEAEPVN